MSATTTDGPKVRICEWCGGTWEVVPLAATDRRTGKSVTLHLCEGCRESRTRTWRLRYSVESNR